MSGEQYKEKRDPRIEMAAAAAGVAGLYVIYQGSRLAWAYSPTLCVLSVLAMIALARQASRFMRRRTARALPAVRGLELGRVKLGRHKLPFFLPWNSLLQHMVVAGPTGLGKSTSVIRPLVAAVGESEKVGMFYMDGKGAPLRELEAHFDAIFDPANPSTSAKWNPLAGGRPEYTGLRFADALYSDIREGLAGQFYIDRGKLALRHTVIAIAYTGYRGETNQVAVKREVREQLRGLGFTENEAAAFIGESLEQAHRQLHYLPYRQDASKIGFEAAFRRRAAAPKKAPYYQAPFSDIRQPHRCVPTVRDVHRCLFDDTSLRGLARHAYAAAERERAVTASADFLRQLASGKDEWREQSLANLESRLTPFLMPPYDVLCAEDELRIGEVVKSRKIALLLSQGGDNGDTAARLGRIALALYQSSVLARRQLHPSAGYSIAIFDEFAPFVTPNFTNFLAQAREHKAGAVMAVQNIGQLRQAGQAEDILANASSVIVTHGQEQSDAEYWSRTFGEEEREVLASRRRAKKRLEGGFIGERTVDKTVRIEQRPIWTADDIKFLPAYHTLVRVRLGQRTWAPYLVDTEIREPSRLARMRARVKRGVREAAMWPLHRAVRSFRGRKVSLAAVTAAEEGEPA